MSRFSALDLAGLPSPTAIVGLDYTSILAARLDELENTLGQTFEVAKVAEIMGLARNIAASPMRFLNEAGAARELYMQNRINEAIRSVLLATASGADLDQIGATRGVVRKVLSDADPGNLIYEKDGPFRARIQLVIEAWSPHGTEGSYVYWALDADDRVVDVVVYGPNHDIDPPIPPAEPQIVVLSSEGDGTAAQELLGSVYDNCIMDRRRPVGDKLTVLSATPVDYAITADLKVTSPEAAGAALEAAEAAAQEFIDGRIRIGRKLFRTSIAAALKVAGVIDVEVTSPAADVDIGPYEAGRCTAVTLTAESYTGGWRDV